MDFSSFPPEELHDISDVLCTILGNEEGIQYVVDKIFQDYDKGNKGFLEYELFRQKVNDLMNLWQNMLNFNVPEKYLQDQITLLEQEKASLTKIVVIKYITSIFSRMKTLVEEALLKSQK